MGAIWGWSALGINSGKGRGKGKGKGKGEAGAAESRSKRRQKKKKGSPKAALDLDGKKVGLELHGTAAASLHAFGNKETYRAIATHAAGGKLSDASLAYQVAYSCTTEIRDIASACSHLYVMSEGNYVMKAHEKQRRNAARTKALNAKEYKQASRVTDCMIELVRNACISDTRLKNVTFINPIGEGEPNLMKMLDCGEIDVAIVPSCDVDCSIYNPSKGVLAINPTVHGDAEDGDVVVEAVAIDFSGGGIWKTFDKNHGKPNASIVDLSSWGILERATLAACVGHDYDSQSSPKGSVSGLKGVSITTAVDAIDSARAGRGDKSAVAFVRDVIKIAKPKSTESDVLRLTNVVVAVIAHPTLKRCRGNKWTSEPYCSLDVETVSHIKEHAEQLGSQLKDAEGAGLRSAQPVKYINCTGCRVNCEDFKEHCDHNVRTITKEFEEASQRQRRCAGFQDLSDSSLPALEESALDAYIETVNACSKEKVKKDGMNRAWDSRGDEGCEDSGRICTAKIKGKNHVCVKMKMDQSYGGKPYMPLVDFIVNKHADKVISINRTACSCVKRHSGVICRHRAGLLMYIWLCDVMGISGNPGHRAKYWAKAHQRRHGKAIRVVDLATDRLGLQKNFRGKGVAKRDVDELRGGISKICRSHFRLDATARARIKALATRHGINKLVREDWDLPSFTSGARGGGRYI